MDRLIEAESKARERTDFQFWLQRVTPTYTWTWPYLVYVQQHLQQLTEGHIKRLMLFMPPRHGKSELVTIRYPIWRMEREPTLRVIIGAYNQILANEFSYKARGIATHRLSLSQRLAVDDWITARGGGLRAVGVGAGVTGRGGDLIVIDDPVKSHEEANSEAYRERVWRWYQNDLYTRLEPGAAMILIQCMAGDTSVLMADGTEKMLRNVRAGDSLASYDRGRLCAAKVLNWKNQGPDLTFAVTTMSGVIVRANGRHPFLVEQEGKTEWIRLQDLKIGDRILRAIGGSGAASHAYMTGVTNPPSAKAIALHTTTRPGGQADIGRRRSILSPEEWLICGTDMASMPMSTTPSWRRKVGSALSADSHQAPRIHGHIGAVNSVLTMIPRLERSGDCCATTVTLRLGTERRKRPCSGPLDTFEIIPDRVVDVALAGSEDVFDIQVEGTENFVANGLISHNTRWHEDDLAGRILASEDAPNWTVISLPAEAEEDDPLGRKVGEPLCAARFGTAALAGIRRVLQGEYYALYQQRPQPPEGSLFHREWFPRREAIARHAASWVVQAWDTAFKEGQGADYSACITLATHSTGIHCLNVWRAQVAFPDLLAAMRVQARQWRPHVILVEDRGAGTSSLQALKKQTLLPLVATDASGGKVERANLVTGLCQSRNVVVPPTTWGDEFLDELLRFPMGKHDDQVDAFVYAMQRILNMAQSASSEEY